MKTPTPFPSELAWIYDLPPEKTGALTFHLPLELQAMRALGVPADTIRSHAMSPLSEAFGQGLIDPPMYRWAVAHYGPAAEALLSADKEKLKDLWVELEPLGEGLAGAAFHGLIRLGYAAYFGQKEELARGLAYMRCRRQVLFSQQEIKTPDEGFVSGRPVVPSVDSTIFDKLNIVSGDSRVLSNADRFGPIPERGSLAKIALAQLRRAPQSFVAVHCLTGIHALVEFERFLAGRVDAALDDWWRAYLLALRVMVAIVDSETHELPRVPGTIKSMDDLVAGALVSNETHCIKVTVALQRLIEEKLIDEKDALIAGEGLLQAAAMGKSC
jgi:hypothetical protein